MKAARLLGNQPLVAMSTHGGHAGKRSHGSCSFDRWLAPRFRLVPIIATQKLTIARSRTKQLAPVPMPGAPNRPVVARICKICRTRYD